MFGKSAFAIFLCLAACKSGESFLKPQPTKSANIATVSIANPEVGIPVGTPIGGIVDEETGELLQEFRAPAALSYSMQEKLVEILAQNLEASGYPVAPTAAAFGLDQSYAADYLVKPSITSLLLRQIKGPKLSRLSASITVDWEIMDLSTNASVYRATTSGQSQGANDYLLAQVNAFTAATKRLLALEQTPRSLMRNHTKQALFADLAVHEQVVLPQAASYKAIDDLGRMLTIASEAVFAIKTTNGHGTGFFIRADGIGLTTRHVVQGRRYWDAYLHDGRTVRIQVLRESPQEDLALVQAVGESFAFLYLGESGALQPGEEIFTIGTPVYLGLGQSVARGIISAIRPEPLRTIIQTDVAINPGSSGGPVLNSHGQVIGIVNQKLIGQDVEGIGFCISINDARAALDLVVQ